MLHTFKKFCKKAFYDIDSKTFVVINDFLAIVIIVSIIAIILESVSSFSPYFPILLFIEYVAVIIFSIEYICRVIGSDKKLAYIFSFFGIVDLISILPTFLHLANLSPLKSARALRILRFLRIIRLAKISHIKHLDRPSPKDSRAVIKLNTQIYITTLVVTVLILGNLIYIFEIGNVQFSNIPISMLWVFESILGGSISSAIPQTYPGIIIFMIARFMGFVLLGLLVHIVGNIASHLLLGTKTTVKQLNTDQ